VPVFVQPHPAVVAKAGAKVILLATARAMVAQLARRHGQEQPLRAFDQFDVADDEGVVEGEGAERLEPSSGLAAEINADFRQLHGIPRVENPQT